MRNYDIIKEVLKIAVENDGLPEWEKDGLEQIQKIKDLIAKHRPILIPKDQRKGSNIK